MDINTLFYWMGSVMSDYTGFALASLIVALVLLVIRLMSDG